MWDFCLACIVPHRRRRSFSKNSEHNKAWLLAGPGGCGAEEPHSVHSSFRFSLCSQTELESMPANITCSSATVLMVNLDNGMSTDSNWRSVESLERNMSPGSHSLIRFSYSEIVHASKNFSKGRVLGKGALSCVYRGSVGLLRTSVAIKRLEKEDKEAAKTFCRELMIASSLHNPHIVPLMGFCIHAEEGLFLVYKYASGGSLERFLHGKKTQGKDCPALQWSVRYKIAIGIAEAIEYLHNGTERCVVHRDIKPSNIVLSSRMEPKLCDFGLATWTPARSVSFLCKTVKGTFGYLAPEYFQNGKVSDKTDVYAFGVVLLELITGRKPIESGRGQAEESLVSWAKPLLQLGGVENLLDPQLNFTRRQLDQIARIIQAASACITYEESLRPDMCEIIKLLRGNESIGLSRKKPVLTGNSASTDINFQMQGLKNEMNCHFALAMLGAEFDDKYHFHCR